MATSKQNVPSLLVFGPQARPSADDLEELRHELKSNPRLAQIYAAALDLPKFLQKLVDFDHDLEMIAAESHLHEFVGWLMEKTEVPYGTSTCPITLTFLLNFMIQIQQYLRFLHYVDTEDSGDAQALMVERLQHGGVHGFCVGFLCAITVSLSKCEQDFADNVVRALHLALAIGVYVDRDAANEKTTCISARWRHNKQAHAIEKALGVLRGYPEAYIATITDETSMTITIPNRKLPGLAPGLERYGFSVREIPVNGRFHSSVYDSVAERLVVLFTQTPDLQFPGPEQLHIPIRSATDGKLIRRGSLVKYALENTLLKTVDWYKTLTLAMTDVPQKQKFIALAGLSNHLPHSLLRNPDIQLTLLRGLAESQSGTVTEPFDNISNTTATGPSNDTDGSWVFASDGEASGDESTADALPSDFPPNAVAVVGMAGRFPGANSVDELWNILSAGTSTVQRAPERVGLEHLSEDYSKKKWWGNFIEDPYTFDHKLFKRSPRDALVTDPQQRKLLEVVYEALESSGYFGAQTCQPQEPTDYGCYIGATQAHYVYNVSTQPPSAYAAIGYERGFISGYVSHYFGWTGPAMTIDTACSSSLVAIHTACQAILAGDCTGAVAGGANIMTSPHDYRDLGAAGFLSPTGQCKPFDADADGYCRSEAVAVVVLKSLAAALKDHDRILGVVLGTAINQNVNEGGNIVVPHSGSQTTLYRKVMALSKVTPGEVTYVEAHGTGTSVGDPIEVRSLRDAFGGAAQRNSTLHIASIKGNIGHAEASAGVAGLIKVLLMLKHGQIPPQASHQVLNPNIPALEPDRMTIPRQLTPWRSSWPVACINSYGAAGSNSAVMACGPPVPDLAAFAQKTGRAGTLSKLPLIVSAAAKSSLTQHCQKLLDWLPPARAPDEPPDDTQLADVLFGLAGRANRSLEHSLIASVSDMDDLKSKLSAAVREDSGALTTVPSPKPLVLVFGGQESQFVGLSEAVHAGSDVFRRHLDACHDLLIHFDLKGLYPAIFQQTPIENVVTLHATLFAIQYASARAWMDCGLGVSAVVGHSFGQLTALCVAGVLSLPDALRLVTGRASLIQTHWGSEPGSMLSVQAERQRVQNLLDGVKDEIDYAEIACVNGPRSHVVVGSSKSIDRLEAVIAEEVPGDNIRAKRLRVTHGFHSVFTETLLAPLEDLAGELEWKSPKMHIELCEESTFNGDLDHRFVAQHTRRPVYFQQAIERLADKYPDCVWLEAGRGSSVMQLVRGCLQSPERHLLFSPQLATPSALDSLVDVTVKLWKEGQKVQYWQFHPRQRLQYRNISLPSYQFQKTQHWIPYEVPKIYVYDSKSPVDQPEVPQRHELLSLVKGDRLREAVFRISPKSDRFKALVLGHIRADRATMPAPLYLEVAARAGLFLQEDLPATTWVPVVEDLALKSPIGLNPESEITLTMKRLDGPSPLWSFAIVLAAAGSAKTQETTTGMVRLNKRTDVQVAQRLKRFATLIDPTRWERILDHPDAERMHGKHIYRAFGQIVQYTDLFKGIKSIACLGSEAAGEVSIMPDAKDAADQRLTDTPMVDSFMQFGDFLSNYFNDASTPTSRFVCHHVERTEFGPAFSPDSGQWVVFARMTDSSEEYTSVDVYVFDKHNKKLVLTVLGMEFSRISCSTGTSLLDDAIRIGQPKTAFGFGSEIHKEAAGDGSVSQKGDNGKPGQPVGASISKRAEIYQIIANVTDAELEEVSGELTLTDIGIDSLCATEMISDINSALNVDLDLSTILILPDINALVAHIDGLLGLDGAESAGDGDQVPAGELVTGSSQQAREKVDERLSSINEDSPKSSNPAGPIIASAYESFDSVRLSFDEIGAVTGALDYWDDVYRDDVRLMMAYVVEEFAKLGCDLKKLNTGEAVPEMKQIPPRHRQLIAQLHRFLGDEHIIAASPATASGYTRSVATIDETPGELIYQQIHSKHPGNATVRHLVRAIGSQLAECLVVDSDGVQFVFGNKTNRQLLEDLYANWPMLATATKLLGNFLRQAFTANTAGGPFRILEVGAGTGGTTRYVVDFLQKHGIQFEYHFTDLSASLAQRMKRSFKNFADSGSGGGSSMTFGVLDVEQEPPAEFLEAFHVVISTNCIHATRDLTRSLANVRKMVREDGAVAMIETTRNMYVCDIIFGLLEGWWLFEDGRSHALADEARWTRALQGAGFQEVLFSDGASAEAKTMRVIAGFPRPHQTSTSPVPVPRQVAVEPEVAVSKRGANNKPAGFTVQEVVYKTVGQLEICADVYCAENADPAKKMPIALMIHGGSHILFSRKDIRPPQTRIMLDMGLLPVSLDHRLCPEVTLAEGPMVDVCDALHWARTELPNIRLKNPNIRPDPDRVVVIGWSSGGQLALSTGWTAPQRGLKPPDAILAFYSPTDYEDEFWLSPNQPRGAEDWGLEYDVLEAVEDEPITSYSAVPSWASLSHPRVRTDPRCRIVLHANWKAQMLPVVIRGLVSRARADREDGGAVDWNALPPPPVEEVRRCSPLAQVRRGHFTTPTFMMHGTADDLIPYAQSIRTAQEMQSRGIDAQVVLVSEAPHVCDMSNDPESAGWKAVLKAYKWLESYI